MEKIRGIKIIRNGFKKITRLGLKITRDNRIVTCVNPA